MLLSLPTGVNPNLMTCRGIRFYVGRLLCGKRASGGWMACLPGC